MRTITLLPAVLALATALGAAADTITLRTGGKLNGKVVVQDSKQVTLRDTKGSFRTFTRDEISKVEFNDIGTEPPAPKPPKAAPPDGKGTDGTPDAAPDEPAPPATAPKQAPADDAILAITEVLASGTGKDADSARKDALRQAVSQVVGSLVVASDVVANDELIDSKILTYSDGYVEKWEPVGEPTSKDGVVRMKIRAWVRQGKLTKALTDNKVPVKDVDLRSMQGQSETLAQQARSAEEVVDALFEGFPAKLLVAEPLTPVRVSGDESGTVFEVPVRVKVDMAKWKAFVAEAKRVLDPIAEAKGSEAWNTKMAGWYPLAGPTSAPKGRPQQGRPRVDTTEPETIAKGRASYWLTRFIPEPERTSGSITTADFGRRLPGTNVGQNRKRVFAVLDNLGGKLSWWQLPKQAWTRLTSRVPSMALHVQIVDGEGAANSTAIQDWEEEVEDPRPGQPNHTVIRRDAGLGRPLLAVGENRDRADDSCAMTCCIELENNGEWTPLARPSDFMRLALPGAIGFEDTGDASFINPSAIFPFRFRVPGEIASLAPDSKIVVEFVDQ